MAELIIDDFNYHLYAQGQVVGGDYKSRGLFPRKAPLGSIPGTSLSAIPSIPRAEWPERYAEMKATKSFLSDIRNHHKLKSSDQDGVPYCFPPGTLIHMADGSEKRIEDVKVLDQVLTAEGNVRRVMQCHAREHRGQLITLRLWGHGHLRLTPNHKVLTRRGYVPAEELTGDDWVAVPRYAPRAAKVIQTTPHMVSAGSRLVVPRSFPTCNLPMPQFNEVPDFIALTPGVGRIFGLFLAEGHTSKSEVIWSFGSHETETLVAELVELLRAEWGLEATTHSLPHNVTTVNVSGTLWARLFRSLFSHGAASKRIHPEVMGGPADFLEAVFSGWMDGDGSHGSRFGAKRGYRIGATVSHSLALSMFHIANFLGHRPSIHREKPQRNRYAKTRQPVWKVKLQSRSDNYRVELADRCTWRRVRELRREDYSGIVLNVGVEGEHSYVAEGVGVSNCWIHGPTNAARLCRARDNQPYVQLSATCAGAQIKNFRREGGWGEEGIRFLAENGTCSVEFWPENSFNRSHLTDEMKANMRLHRVTEWDDLPQRNLDALHTYGFLRIPVAVGYNWWGHEVCYCDPVETGVSEVRTDTGKLSLTYDQKYIDLLMALAGFGDSFLDGRIWNSWSDDWGTNGMGILRGSKLLPDDAVAPRVIVAATV